MHVLNQLHGADIPNGHRRLQQRHGTLLNSNDLNFVMVVGTKRLFSQTISDTSAASIGLERILTTFKSYSAS